MKIPAYWAHETESVQGPDGRWLKLAIWRWSDASTAEAAGSARARVTELVARVKQGETLNRYAYGERPLREEIVQGVPGGSGQAGVITRNGYGAAVLNAPNAMFIDIDFQEEGPSTAVSAVIRNLRGQPPQSQEQLKVAAVEQWAARNPGLGLRLYRTAGGLRALVTNELFDPAAESTRDLLRALDSDPLYIRLCRDQGCFRARLSPKPWRCGVGKPPARFPWENADVEMRYRAWDQRYQAASTRFTVCRLVKQIGPAEVHPEVQPVLDIHDRMASSEYNLPLA